MSKWTNIKTGKVIDSSGVPPGGSDAGWVPGTTAPAPGTTTPTPYPGAGTTPPLTPAPMPPGMIPDPSGAPMPLNPTPETITPFQEPALPVPTTPIEETTASGQARQFGNTRLANKHFINAAFQELYKEDASLSDLAKYNQMGIMSAYEAIKASRPIKQIDTDAGMVTIEKKGDITTGGTDVATGEVVDDLTGAGQRFGIDFSAPVEARQEAIEAGQAELDIVSEQIATIQNEIQDTVDFYETEKETIENRLAPMGSINRELHLMNEKRTAALAKLEIREAIAQGQFDRSSELIRENADLIYNMELMKLDWLKELDTREYNEAKTALEAENKLALAGMVKMNMEQFQVAIAQARQQGMTDAQIEQELIYRKPGTDDIYLRPGFTEAMAPDEIEAGGGRAGTPTGEPTGVFDADFEGAANVIMALENSGASSDEAYWGIVSGLAEDLGLPEESIDKMLIQKIQSMKGEQPTQQQPPISEEENVASDFITKGVGETTHPFEGGAGMSLQNRATELIESLSNISGFSQNDIIISARKQLKQEGYPVDEVDKIISQTGLRGLGEKIASLFRSIK